MKRKFISFLFVSALAYSAKSQVFLPAAQVSVDLSKQHFSGEEGLVNSEAKYLVGGNIGVYGTLLFAKDIKKNAFTLTAGLEYAQKGVKSDETDFKAKAHANYIQLPVYAGYNLVAGPGALFAGIGPYIAYGVDGKIKADGEESINTFGENDGGFKRFDAGGAVRVGYRLDKGLLLVLGYQHGITNIGYESHDFNSKNRSFSIAVGYAFGKHK
ncbi:MAG: porin family protein [Chitinophagaceae bacterium]